MIIRHSLSSSFRGYLATSFCRRTASRFLHIIAQQNAVLQTKRPSADGLSSFFHSFELKLQYLHYLKQIAAFYPEFLCKSVVLRPIVIIAATAYLLSEHSRSQAKLPIWFPYLSNDLLSLPSHTHCLLSQDQCPLKSDFCSMQRYTGSRNCSNLLIAASKDSPASLAGTNCFHCVSKASFCVNKCIYANTSSEIARLRCFKVLCKASASIFPS